MAAAFTKNVGVVLLSVVWFCTGLIVGCELYDSFWGPADCQGLEMWYRDYNHRFFFDELPKDTLVEYSSILGPQYLALTVRDEKGRFHIRLSRRYNQSARVAHWAELHEMCHIETWEEGNEHGPVWDACMTRLFLLGAYKGVL